MYINSTTAPWHSVRNGSDIPNWGALGHSGPSWEFSLEVLGGSMPILEERLGGSSSSLELPDGS